MNHRFAFTFALGAIALTGCSAIRVVHQSPAGGEIALLGVREDAMEKAELEMAANCGGPESYRVIEQGEVVVGQQSTAQATEDTQRTGRRGGRQGSRTVVTATETTQDVTEWRVKYACVGAEPTSALREVRVRF